MNRPFFNDSISQLEARLQERMTDKEFLKLLAEELSFRSTGKAIRLRERVSELLQPAASNPKSSKPKAAPIEATGFPTLTLADYQGYTVKQDTPIPLINNPSAILSAWIALEVLSPQTFRREQDLAGAGGSIVRLDKLLLPWEGNGEKSKPNYKLYYQVVLGTINFPKAIDALLNIYADKRVERPTPKGEAILAVVVVDNKGRPVEDPAIAVSSFAWGVPQALKGDLGVLSEWEGTENVLNTILDKILRRTDDEGNELPLDAVTLKTATSFLISQLGIPTEFITGNTFAIRAYEYFKNSNPPEPLLLNSFFISDLIIASSLFKEGNATDNLRRYVGQKHPNTRKDLLHDRNAFEEAVAPAMMPPARWPGPDRKPLVMLQQAAVNLALKELGEGGILAVNGPPGTGKTTLLRDIVAGIITYRAEAMCTFDDPVDAFTNSGERVSAGPAWWTLHEVDKRLKGFEILITSSNNKAVENVSAELPGLKAIADDAIDLRYFTCLSDTLLERESWGLIAAVLGNAINRSRFRQNFWWDKEIGMATYLAEASGTPQLIDVVDEQTGKVTATRKPRIIIAENAPGNHDEAVERWKISRKAFQQVLAESQSILSKLEEVRKKVIALTSLQQERAKTEQVITQTKANYRKLTTELEAGKAALIQIDSNLEQAKQKEQDHKKLYPGFFAFLFKRTQLRAWKQQHAVYRSEVVTAKQEHERITHAIQNIEKAVDLLRKSLNDAETKYATVSNKCAELEKPIQEARTILGPHLIDEEFFGLSHEKKHILSPWCDKVAQRARDNVFVEAMRLHKAFTDAAAKPLRHNLGALMQAFGRSMPDEKKQKLVPDLWSSLFMIVPSVSTTFASVERMLGSLPPESIGWLLIDEAGQALPQAAVGAIMRTKRAVVVGDPIQIEPVVTLPDILTQNICRRFGIDPARFNAPQASAQTLADTATAYFAEFEGRQGSRSVGVPLLVHRRCDDPMFSISNAIAYERLMVQAKQPHHSSIKDFLGPSRWFNVQGQAQDKWCPEEGAIVLDMLNRLRAANIKPDLYIVTPFVIVADNLRKIIRDSGVLGGWVENEMNWPYERVGTVHTVQGREADAVIFVLGAPNPQQTGARGWAGGSPNLLNVAVTRAKEGLYVIGNRQLWQGAGLFSELASRL